MEELEVEVGEYVRTKDGLIAKVLSDDGLFLDIDKRYFNEHYQSMRKFINHEQIAKHSFNILELIECGDILEVEVGGFVHKYEIYASTYYSRAIHDVNDGTNDLEEYISDYCNGKFNIITHEQFNSIKYEVI